MFIKLAQITINDITDKMRNCLVANRDEDSVDLNCWNLIASTNIRDYITRKKQRFNGLFVKHLNALGIITYFDLLNESKFPRSDRIKIFADNVLTSFPKEWGLGEHRSLCTVMGNQPFGGLGVVGTETWPSSNCTANRSSFLPWVSRWGGKVGASSQGPSSNPGSGASAEVRFGAAFHLAVDRSCRCTLGVGFEPVSDQE